MKFGIKANISLLQITKIFTISKAILVWSHSILYLHVITNNIIKPDPESSGDNFWLNMQYSTPDTSSLHLPHLALVAATEMSLAARINFHQRSECRVKCGKAYDQWVDDLYFLGKYKYPYLPSSKRIIFFNPCVHRGFSGEGPSINVELCLSTPPLLFPLQLLLFCKYIPICFPHARAMQGWTSEGLSINIELYFLPPLLLFPLQCLLFCNYIPNIT